MGSFLSKLFTRRFIKDLVLIIVIGGSLYILTHNSIVRPTPITQIGLWSIQLMQYPLVFGMAGHNYLVLKDGNNKTVHELHGLATELRNGKYAWKYIGTKETDKLVVWEFDSPHYYKANKSFPGVVLHEGDMATTYTIWKKTRTCKETINNMNFPYPPYGVNVRGDTENSNSVAYTLIMCMNLDPKHIGLITPGWGKNLLSEGN
jgi:hypothetical protein